MTKEIRIECFCGRVNTIMMTGNNNADGKCKCICGRNITIHFRRHK